MQKIFLKVSSVRLLHVSSILRTGSDVLSHELEPKQDGCAPAGSASINLIQIGRTLHVVLSLEERSKLMCAEEVVGIFHASVM